MSVALTTIDNPYHPLDDFQHWYQFDMLNGYHTCEFLDRVAYCSNGLSDKENELEIERAIDKIISDDPFHIYKKVTSDD